MGIKEVDTNYINTWGGRPCNGPNSCGVGDKFNAEIYTSNGKKYLKTTRLDSGGGWGMQVKFKAKILEPNNSAIQNEVEAVEVKKDLYTFVGKGECHNDTGRAQQDCRVDPNCNFIGQQSNGCWHKLKQDNNGISKKSSYPRGFYEVI